MKFLILLFSLMFPKEKILILGILPIPAIFGALLFVGFDIWGVNIRFVYGRRIGGILRSSAGGRRLLGGPPGLWRRPKASAV